MEEITRLSQGPTRHVVLKIFSDNWIRRKGTIRLQSGQLDLRIKHLQISCVYLKFTRLKNTFLTFKRLYIVILIFKKLMANSSSLPSTSFVFLSFHDKIENHGLLVEKFVKFEMIMMIQMSNNYVIDNYVKNDLVIFYRM